jgi:deazaflavin-dependent oxidoreductase (nitroreductase family)
MGSRSLHPLLRWLLRAPLRLYDWRLGWLLGERFLRLSHVGRRSGHQHNTVLEVVGRNHSNGEVVVVAGVGAHADWYRNVQADPRVNIIIGRRRYSATARTLNVAEAADVVACYERRNRWLGAVIHRVLTWLVGWPYDGSQEARRRLVEELPLVAFRPETRPNGRA